MTRPGYRHADAWPQPPRPVHPSPAWLRVLGTPCPYHQAAVGEPCSAEPASLCGPRIRAAGMAPLSEQPGRR